jgi:copper(I)-binding protein
MGAALVPIKLGNLLRLLASMICGCTLFSAVNLETTAAELRREVAAGDIVIVNAWMPQPLGSAKTGVVYLTIENRGDAADQLVGAESPGAEHLMVHESKDIAGVMKMMPLKNIKIPGHGKIELKPMGIHLMTMGLKTSPKQWDTFPLVLKFSRSGTVSVDVVVQAPNALQPTR